MNALYQSRVLFEYVYIQVNIFSFQKTSVFAKKKELSEVTL